MRIWIGLDRDGIVSAAHVADIPGDLFGTSNSWSADLAEWIGGVVLSGREIKLIEAPNATIGIRLADDAEVIYPRTPSMEAPPQ